LIMQDTTEPTPARDPQDLERLLVDREHIGDVEGMVALYEEEATLDAGDGQVIHGQAAIGAFFAGLVAEGRVFVRGEQGPAVISGDLALTSTRLPDGTVTAEVARRQRDGTWLWVVDKFTNA